MKVRALLSALCVFLSLSLSACSGLRHFADPIEPPTSPRASPTLPTSALPPAQRERHRGAGSFTGTVTGYSERPGEEDVYGCDDVDCVRVDGAVVDLALIVPFGASCDERIDDDAKQAAAAKERLLPVGTRVRVVRDEPKNSSWHDFKGVIHIAAEYDPVHPFIGSVNEQLVGGGYWVPDDRSFNTTEVGGGYASRYRSDIAAADLRAIAPIQAGYVLRITRAANRARLHGAGGQMTCVLQLIKRAEEDERTRAHVDAQNRRISIWWKKYVSQHPEIFRCRDGDGDGVCHER